jgi:hypothetical protein
MQEPNLPAGVVLTAAAKAARIQQGAWFIFPQLWSQTFTDRTTNDQVLVKKYPVDWNEPADDTAIRALQLIRHRTPGCHYLNPAYTVSADSNCPEFIRRARQYRIRWCTELCKVFGSGGRRRSARRMAREEKPESSYLMHNGHIVIDGVEYDSTKLLRLPQEGQKKPRSQRKNRNQHHNKRQA